MPLQNSNLLFKSELKFDMGKIFPFSNDMYDILTSSFAVFIKKLPSSGTFRIITEVYRPDIIAWKIYNSIIYKIPLMLYNDIVSPLDCYAHRLIQYPSVMDLDNLLFNRDIQN